MFEIETKKKKCQNPIFHGEVEDEDVDVIIQNTVKPV